MVIAGRQVDDGVIPARLTSEEVEHVSRFIDGLRSLAPGGEEGVRPEFKRDMFMERLCCTYTGATYWYSIPANYGPLLVKLDKDMDFLVEVRSSEISAFIPAVLERVARNNRIWLLAPDLTNHYDYSGHPLTPGTRRYFSAGETPMFPPSYGPLTVEELAVEMRLVSLALRDVGMISQRVAPSRWSAEHKQGAKYLP